VKEEEGISLKSGTDLTPSIPLALAWKVKPKATSFMGIRAHVRQG
jgi:hypothetical protein